MNRLNVSIKDISMNRLRTLYIQYNITVYIPIIIDIIVLITAPTSAPSNPTPIPYNISVIIIHDTNNTISSI